MAGKVGTTMVRFAIVGVFSVAKFAIHLLKNKEQIKEEIKDLQAEEIVAESVNVITKEVPELLEVIKGQPIPVPPAT